MKQFIFIGNSAAGIAAGLKNPPDSFWNESSIITWKGGNVEKKESLWSNILTSARKYRHYYCPFCKVDITPIIPPISPSLPFRVIFPFYILKTCPSCKKKIYFSGGGIGFAWYGTNPLLLGVLVICGLILVLIIFIVFFMRQ